MEIWRCIIWDVPDDHDDMVSHHWNWACCHYGNSINKANLRDLIAATGLVILLKLDSNCQFFSPCDLEIWWMTMKNYRAPLLHYTKLCASSRTPQWIQTGVTVWNAQFGSKWAIFSCDQAALQMFFSVCPSVCLSHLFDYVAIILSSWKFQELLPMTKVRSMQKVKVRGQRSRSQRSQPNLTVSGL